MKPQLILSIVLLLLCAFTGVTQNVAINNNNAPPNANAMLDIDASSNDKGILIPRISSSQRKAMEGLSASENGLLVYVEDEKTFWYFNGAAWVEITAGPVALSDQDSDTEIRLEESPDEDIIRFYLEDQQKMVLLRNPHNEARLELLNASGSLFIGEESGASNEELSSNNLGIGSYSLFANTSGINNMALGANALGSNTTGSFNLAIGNESLMVGTKSTSNTAIGHGTLRANDEGSINVAVGSNALRKTVDGKSNVAIGHSALIDNIAGDNNIAVGESALAKARYSGGNVAVGFEALSSFETAATLPSVAIGISALKKYTGVSQVYHNTAVGSYSMSNTTTGVDNTALGGFTLSSNITGGSNTAIGAYALYKNTEGNFNTAIGKNANRYNTSGKSNVAVGFGALKDNEEGDSNVAIGYSALASNINGIENIALGSSAMAAATYANGNVAIGNEALSSFNKAAVLPSVAIGIGALKNYIGLSQVYHNTAVGSYSMINTTTGVDNTALGGFSLATNISGNSNSAIGAYALNENIEGDSNTAIGKNANRYNTSGNGNVSVGVGALYESKEGDSNVALGNSALANNINGDENTSIGRNALGKNTSGGKNTAIGFEAFNTDGNFTNSSAVGYQTVINASNQIRLGNANVTSIGGVVDWTELSDGRFKSNIKEDVPGLDFILKLRPVTYDLDLSEYNRFLGLGEEAISRSAQRIEVKSGFIAQEIEQTSESIGYQFSGLDKPDNESDAYGLRYSQFVVPIVKSIQEQQLKIEALEKQNQELIRRLEKLENK